MTEAERRLRRQQWIQFTVFGALFIFALISLFLINNLLLSFVVALVFNYIVSPFVSQLESAGVNRLTAILGVYVALAVLVGLGIWAMSPFLVDQFQSLKESLPHYIDGVVSLSERLNGIVNSSAEGLFHVDLSGEVRSFLTAQSTNLVKVLPGFLSSTSSVLVLSPLLGFFILKDGQQISNEILRLVPNNIFELVLSLQSQISNQIAQFIRARLLESLIVGTVVLVCLWIVGFPFPIFLAVFAALANLIPYIGPIVGAAPGLLVAAVNSGIGLKVFIVVLVYLLAQLIDIFFIIPLVVARVVNLHPITVILVVILGAEMLGVLGMIISIPVAAALKVTFVNIYRHLTDYAV